uniref:UPAR/Ly6 domain-containing protein n=1 Tax=Anabas testudineus TaxID=64144 RepID=A0AAQ6IV21_ANATE
MRTVLCAVLLLTLHLGEALKCNYCMSYEDGLCTGTSVQFCGATQDACGAVILQNIGSSFRMCMNMGICQGWIQTRGAIAMCCSTDLCN